MLVGASGSPQAGGAVISRSKEIYPIEAISEEGGPDACLFPHSVQIQVITDFTLAILQTADCTLEDGNVLFLSGFFWHSSLVS